MDTAAEALGAQLSAASAELLRVEERLGSKVSTPQMSLTPGSFVPAAARGFLRTPVDVNHTDTSAVLQFNTRSTGTTAATINPLEMLERIKRLQEQLPALQADCEQIVAKKAELREATTVTMAANRQTIT